MAVDNGVAVLVREKKAIVETSAGEPLKTLRFAEARSASDLASPALEAEPKRRRELHACIAWLLELGTGDRITVEKRSQRRYPFRRPLSVTPVNNQSGRPDLLKSFPAFGIDISYSGICFLARQLVPVRRAVLSMEGPGNETVTLLFEPRWVRFTRGGWYQTGGKLLEVVPEEKDGMPVVRLLEPPPDIEELCGKSRHSRLKPL